MFKNVKTKLENMKATKVRSTKSKKSMKKCDYQMRENLRYVLCYPMKEKIHFNTFVIKKKASFFIVKKRGSFLGMRIAKL